MPHYAKVIIEIRSQNPAGIIVEKKKGNSKKLPEFAKNRQKRP